MASKKLIDHILEAAEDKKARDIKVFDIKKQSSMWDCQILMTADSPPQIRAIVDEIKTVLNKKHSEITSVKAIGEVNSGWIILDLGDVVVHVLQEDIRKHYSLEEIWKQPGVIFHY